TALGARAQVAAADAVALGAGSVADRAGSVSIGSAGHERQLTNVAAGLLSATSTEAVNGAQLFGMGDSMAQFLGGGASMGANGFTGPSYLIQGGNYYNVGDALGALDGAISGI